MEKHRSINIHVEYFHWLLLLLLCQTEKKETMTTKWNIIVGYSRISAKVGHFAKRLTSKTSWLPHKRFFSCWKSWILLVHQIHSEKKHSTHTHKLRKKRTNLLQTHTHTHNRVYNGRKKNEHEPNKSYHAQNSNPKIQNPETKRLIRYMGIIKKTFSHSSHHLNWMEKTGREKQHITTSYY